MKAKRVFHPQQILADARAGRLSRAALRKAIATAEDFGDEEVAEQLRKHAADAFFIAADATPLHLRNRLALGIRQLAAMGQPTTRARQMLRRDGVIETLNKMARTQLAEKSYSTLRTAGFTHLSAESIVLDMPHLFDPKVVAVARQRLGR